MTGPKRGLLLLAAGTAAPTANGDAEATGEPADGATPTGGPEASAAAGETDWTERYISALSDGAPAEAGPEASAEAVEAAETAAPTEEGDLPGGEEVEQAVPSTPGAPYLCNRVTCRTVCGGRRE
eukprot:TRINITY_DN5151_c0_g1_i5.p2 TRINITY_DN5151_c0_g1~~TRINITY_DN5151_c0_g1_i5.p2  ORF type:complete len:125 (-),score=43.73 TRINITY_DN5151_c0_g1_i5:301-675(-)